MATMTLASHPDTVTDPDEFKPSWPGEEGVKDSRIMIVDDEPYNVLVVRKLLLNEGYKNFVTTSKPTQAVEQLRREQPDVLLLDVMMPDVSGLDILKLMRADSQLRAVPVIVLTAACDGRTKSQALELGAADFLAKPVEPSELVPRLRNVLSAKAHRDQLQQYSTLLERRVREQTRELEASRKEVIFCLARAAEFRDDDTGQHVLRVGRYAGVIARELGLDPDHVEMVELAAQLHDVGKIGISDAILLKPGKLDPDEFELMKKHCKFGKNIIHPISQGEWERLRTHTEVGAKILDAPSSPILRLAAVIAQTHHERWDGSGYPLGLAGEDIPLEGRITAVADVFDALSSARPYKPPFPRERCFQILEEGRGTHFDPRVLDAFFRSTEHVVRIQIECMDRD
jgi:putative two-component system response regulator